MADIKALFFDMDGVIIDTERDGHRVAFNQAFKFFGYDFNWDEERYHQLLQVAGGKERMRAYFAEEGLFQELSEEEMAEHLLTVHLKKTEIFLQMIETGALPLRPGIKRFMLEAMEADIQICLCTTAAEQNAAKITGTMLHEISFAHILAGDMVTRKKPDPEIYNLALQKTGLAPEDCIVVEDSAIGVAAATAAGLQVIATTNGYTEDEDLSSALIIVSCLGDEDGPQGVLSKAPENLDFNGVLYLSEVIKCFS